MGNPPASTERQAAMALAAGKAALAAYAERGHVHPKAAPRETITAIVDTWEHSSLDGTDKTSLLLARTNGQVREINTEVRNRMRANGMLRGAGVTIDAVTSSGQAHLLDLAVGDEIRFLMCHGGLWVINGTTGIVTALSKKEAASRRSPRG